MAYFEELLKEFREGKTLSFHNGRARVRRNGKRLGLDIPTNGSEMEILMAAILVEDDWKVEKEEEKNDINDDVQKLVLEGLQEILNRFNKGEKK